MSESTVFVVRIWHDAGAFRATARAVESDDTSVFSDPAELLRFLAPDAVRASAGKDPKPIVSRVQKSPANERSERSER